MGGGKTSTRITTTKNKNLKLLRRSLAGCSENKQNKKKFSDLNKYRMLTDIFLEMDNRKGEGTQNIKRMYLSTDFFSNHGDLNIVILFF